MNYQKAIDILGLKPNFSEEELKEAYRKLSRKYHPDNYMEAPEAVRLENEEKMKEINAAHSYFVKLKETTGDYHIEYNIYMPRRHRIARSKELLSFVEDIPDVQYPEYFEQYYRRLKYLIEDYNQDIANLKVISSIDILYNEALEQIKEELKNFRNAYIVQEGLSLKDLGDISYNMSIGDFYLQLEEAKTRKKEELENKIKREILKYEMRDGSLILSGKIAVIVNEAIKELREKGHFNIDINEIICRVDKEIEDLFDKYDSVMKKFDLIRGYFVDKYSDMQVENIERKRIKDLLESEVKNEIPSEEADIILEILNLKNEFMRKIDFGTIIEKLEALQEKIEDFKRKDKAKNERLKELFKVVTDRFQRRMLEYSENECLGNMLKAVNIYECFLGLYNKAVIRELDLNEVIWLEDITFRDFKKDNILVRKYDYKSRVLEDLEVYIMFGEELKLGSRLFLVENWTKDRIAFAYFVDSNKRRASIPRDILSSSYISLDDFLEKGLFIGKKKEDYLILYSLGDYTLVVTLDGKFRVNYRDKIEGLYSYIAVPYKNKLFTKLMVQKMIMQEQLQNGVEYEVQTPEELNSVAEMPIIRTRKCPLEVWFNETFKREKEK